MSILLSYVPWLVFLAVTGAADWRIGLTAGLAAQVVVLLTATPRRVGVLDAGMLVFFAGFGAYSLVAPHSGLEPYLTNISMVWMTVLAGASVLVGRPFTLKFSEDGVPPEVAASALFLSINRHIALAWTGAFAIMAVAGFASQALDRAGWGTMVSVLAVVAAIRFTKRYPDRAVAAAATTRPAPALAG